MSLVDHNVVRTRLGYPRWLQTDYHFEQASCCHAVFIENREIMTAYFDPHDLSRSLLLEQDVCCPLCGATDWEILDVTDPRGVPSSWQWACRPAADAGQ